MDNNLEQKLYGTFKKALNQKRAISAEELPSGVLGVEYHPTNLGEKFRGLGRDKAIVKVQGVPQKDIYQKAAEKSDLTLTDRSELMFQDLMREGETGFDFTTRRGDYPVASLKYTPQMGTRHEVTIYKAGNAGSGAVLLANYLNLTQGQK